MKKGHGKLGAALTLAKRHAVTIIFALILANALVYAFTHVEGPSQYGDDPVYLSLAAQLVRGTFTISQGFIFSVRLTEAFAIAFFYSIFGVSNLSSSLWNITSYIGLIVVAFYFTRMQYGERAALISAFLVTVFPIAGEIAVNVGEDIPLAFITSLSFLMFLYGERFNKRKFYLASGILLVAAWLTSYEAAAFIVFLLLYAMVEALRKKVTINMKSLHLLYGIGGTFLIVFLFSWINVGYPFITITENLRFYSGVATHVNGLPTIPSTNQDLGFYIGSMFPYHVLQALQHAGLPGTVSYLFSVVTAPVQNVEYGLFFYLVIPAIAALLLLREKKSFLAISWFMFLFLVLEFGPMHVGISTNPLSIIYLPAYRLTRFMLILTVPLSATIAIAMSKLIEFKNPYMSAVGAVAVLFMFVLMYASNYYSSSFFYYWQHYPQEIVMQAVRFVRALPQTTPVYLEGIYNNANIGYSSSFIEIYLGDPLGSRVDFQISNTTNCTTFASGGYVIWSGPSHCPNWTNAYNITTPSDIPGYIIAGEGPLLFDRPTNIYRVN